EESAIQQFARALAQAAKQPPLVLMGVADRAVPNQERVWLLANENVNLAEYLLLVGLHLPNQQFLPFTDHLLWLGNHAVDAGTAVVVYTGSGQERVARDVKSGNPILVLYWGRAQTVFTVDVIVPGLIRVMQGQVHIGHPGK